MSRLTAFRSQQRPRELRRRVMVRARMRAQSGWSDACILNVSSRGMLINASAPAVQGSTIEVWHGEHLIVATVMWRNGTRAGLHANERIPVEEILALAKYGSPAHRSILAGSRAAQGRPATGGESASSPADRIRRRGRLRDFFGCRRSADGGAGARASTPRGRGRSRRLSVSSGLRRARGTRPAPRFRRSARH